VDVSVLQVDVDTLQDNVEHITFADLTEDGTALLDEPCLIPTYLRHHRPALLHRSKLPEAVPNVPADDRVPLERTKLSSHGRPGQRCQVDAAY